MTSDDRERVEALCRAIWHTAPRAVEPIPAGLGLRRFHRVRFASGHGAPPSAIARVEAAEDPAGRPDGVPPEPALEPIRALLEAAGLPVPAHLATSPDGTLTLLEDLGDTTLEDVARRDRARARRLLERAAGDLPRLQAIADPGGVAAFQRRLDATLFAYKARLFSRHSLPLALGRAPTPAECGVVASAFAGIARTCAAAPQRLAHRDFQSRNLLVAGDRVRWIDLQGAFLAPPEYDLVCLLRDSYVEWDEAVVDAVCAAIRPRLPDAPDPASFARRFDLLTLTRKGKDHARFLYVHETRGDPSALAAVGPTTRHLKRAAARVERATPELGQLVDWVRALPDAAPDPGPEPG